jgi:hypothetical protein
LPKKVKLHYKGKFDVVNDLSKARQTGDWKGNIAFNGSSIRASEQSAWYPILYDDADGSLIHKVTYNLNIECEDCKSIYINGSTPFKGSTHQFIAIEPFALMLYAGEVDFVAKGKVHYINSGLSANQLDVISTWTERIIHFYDHKLNIPYGNDITYIYTTPVTKDNAWMFFTYPAITIIGHEKYNMKSYFNKNNNLRDSSLIQYLSHEMGHYYIGNVMIPNGTLRWAFLEGITEYMSLLATKELISEKAYRAKLIDYLSQINGYEPKPLSSIKDDEIDETYRYAYMPLLLSTLEKKVGKEAMWRWIKTLVSSDKNIVTDYSFFKSSFLKSGVSEEDYKVFEFICINANNAKENVVKIINKGL